MLLEKDVYWSPVGSGTANKVKAVEFESIVSTGSTWWIKDTEVDEGPYQVIAIKCYKVVATNDITCFVSIAQYRNEHGHIEQYIVDSEREELHFEDLLWGTLMNESEKNEYLEKFGEKLLED